VAFTMSVTLASRERGLDDERGHSQLKPTRNSGGRRVLTILEARPPHEKTILLYVLYRVRSIFLAKR